MHEPKRHPHRESGASSWKMMAAASGSESKRAVAPFTISMAIVSSSRSPCSPTPRIIRVCMRECWWSDQCRGLGKHGVRASFWIIMRHGGASCAGEMVGNWV